VHDRTRSPVRRVEFVSARIILRGILFHIIVLNIHATTGDKSDNGDNVCSINSLNSIQKLRYEISMPK
jgi:hypothetical protein